MSLFVDLDMEKAVIQDRLDIITFLLGSFWNSFNIRCRKPRHRLVRIQKTDSAAIETTLFGIAVVGRIIHASITLGTLNTRISAAELDADSRHVASHSAALAEGIVDADITVGAEQGIRTKTAAGLIAGGRSGDGRGCDESWNEEESEDSEWERRHIWAVILRGYGR
jgi:hypothetical protein